MIEIIYGILISVLFIDVAALFVWWRWPRDLEIYLPDDWVPYGNSKGRGKYGRS